MNAQTATRGNGITLVECEKQFRMPEKMEVEKLLKHPSVANLPVMVLAVIGKCRTGKSFLLNYFLRYLYNQQGMRNVCDKPLGEENAHLQGFSWSNRLDKATRGILIWNHVFKIRGPQSEEVAVIILDTEGLFDRNLTETAEAFISSLTATISSFLIFNVQEQISQEILRTLEQRICEKNVKMDVHQQEYMLLAPKLLFLVRDWKYPREHRYGTEGGDRYLSEIFREKTFLMEIKKFFMDMECFLMPYPGNKVAGFPDDDDDDDDAHKYEWEYDGNLAAMKRSFKENLEKLCEMIFSPDRLVLTKKTIREVTCEGIFNMLLTYTDRMHEALHSPLQAMRYMAITECSLKEIVAAYKKVMQQYIGDNTPYQEESKLKEIYEHLKTESRLILKNEISIRYQIDPNAFVEMLDEGMAEYWEYIKSQNERKIQVMSTEHMRKQKQESDRAAIFQRKEKLKGSDGEERCCIL